MEFHEYSYFISDNPTIRHLSILVFKVEIAFKTLTLIKNSILLRFKDSSTTFILSVNIFYPDPLSLDSQTLQAIDTMFFYSFSTRDKQGIKL